MNQRVLVAGNARPADPARSRLAEALAEITGQPVEVFLERLDDATPWLLDLPNAGAAQRLADGAFAAAGVRATLVPAVGAPAPSRAAGLAFLEARLSRELSSVEGQTRAPDETLARRAEAAREKARALAEDRGTARRPSGPVEVGRPVVPETRPTRSRSEASPVPDRPHPQLDLEPERPIAVRLGLGVAVLLLAGYGLAPFLAAPVLRGRLQDHLDAQLRTSGGAPLVSRETLDADVARVLRESGYPPEAFRVGLFLADDVQAAAMELKAGFPPRTPESGLRLRARVQGEGTFLGRGVDLDVYVDVVVPTARVTGRVEPSWEDFVRLDAP
jgi:hypothetical protein